MGYYGKGASSLGGGCEEGEKDGEWLVEMERAMV